MKHSIIQKSLRTLTGAVSLALILSSATAHADGKIVFISHAPDSDGWWNTIKNSLKHASEDFSIQVEYRNPKTGDLKEMAKLIDEAVAQKPDGIITTIADYDVLKDSLLKASAQKIPVITVNSGTHKQSESVGAILHIGQPEDVAGQRAGAKLAQTGIKSFVCLNHYSNNPASHERCRGFAQGLGLQNAEELKLTGDEKQMEGQIQDYLTVHPNTEAILGLGPLSTHPALTVVKNMKSGKQPAFVHLRSFRPHHRRHQKRPDCLRHRPATLSAGLSVSRADCRMEEKWLEGSAVGEVFALFQKRASHAHVEVRADAADLWRTAYRLRSRLCDPQQRGQGGGVQRNVSLTQTPKPKTKGLPLTGKALFMICQ